MPLVPPFLLFDYFGAIADYNKAIELKPDFSGAHRTLADLLMDSRQIQEALSEAKETVRLMPNVPGPHYVLGTALIANADEQNDAVVNDAVTNDTVTNVGTFVFQDQAPGSIEVDNTTATGVAPV